MPKLYQTKSYYSIDVDEVDGTIVLFIVDDTGHPVNKGEILTINNTGSLYLHTVDAAAAKKAGIMLNPYNKIAASTTP